MGGDVWVRLLGAIRRERRSWLCTCGWLGGGDGRLIDVYLNIDTSTNDRVNSSSR